MCDVVRKAKSQWISMVCVDARNVFNSESWKHIIDAVEETWVVNLIENYQSYRKINLIYNKKIFGVGAVIVELAIR